MAIPVINNTYVKVLESLKAAPKDTEELEADCNCKAVSTLYSAKKLGLVERKQDGSKFVYYLLEKGEQVLSKLNELSDLLE